jgi:hypothetical protein
MSFVIRQTFLKHFVSNVKDGMQDNILWDNSESAMKMLQLQNVAVSQKKIRGAF